MRLTVASCIFKFPLKIFKLNVGDGVTRKSGAAGASSQSKISSDEMEQLRKVLPYCHPSRLQRIALLHHHVFVAAYEERHGEGEFPPLSRFDVYVIFSNPSHSFPPLTVASIRRKQRCKCDKQDE
jgi:hypothetical protein